MRNGLLLIQIVLLFTVSSADCQTGGSESRPSIPTSKLKIIPWVELNYPPRYVEKVVEGLLIWKNVTDTAIVSTMPGRADLYRELRKRVPGIRIIPGLKTMDLLPRFDSVEGWKAVAKEVSAICATSGEHVIVLDNEVAIMDCWRYKKYKIDLARLRKGLRQLPEGIEFIWYPSIVGTDEEGQRRLKAVCRVTEAVLNVRFTEMSLSVPQAAQTRLNKGATERLEAIVKKPMIPMVYCYGPGSPWWQDEQIPSVLNKVRGEWVILYPGIKRWPEAARSLSERLGLVLSTEQP